MSGGEVAGILVAVFWAILVSFLAVALVRLAQTLRATTKLVADGAAGSRVSGTRSPGGSRDGSWGG